MTAVNSAAVDLIKSVTEPLPLSARTTTNTTTFHIIKLPQVNQNLDRFRHLTAQFCIQLAGQAAQQTVWWTSFIVIAKQGLLTRGTGVYNDWPEFGAVSSQPAIGIVAIRTDGITIAQTQSGVLNGNRTNGAVLCDVDMEAAPRNGSVEMFAVLVTAGMHDGAYQVHGQARLEYSVW